LRPNIFLSSLFSNTIGQYSPSIWQTKFHALWNNRQDYSSVYLNLYASGQQTGRQKILHRVIASVLWLSLLLISSWMTLRTVRLFPKYLNCSTFQRSYYLYLCCAFVDASTNTSTCSNTNL
jgi:hypothetical protein